MGIVEHVFRDVTSVLQYSNARHSTLRLDTSLLKMRHRDVNKKVVEPVLHCMHTHRRPANTATVDIGAAPCLDPNSRFRTEFSGQKKEMDISRMALTKSETETAMIAMRVGTRTSELCRTHNNEQNGQVYLS
jgi:hypothetical protein